VSAVVKLEGNERCVILPFEFGEAVMVGGSKGLAGVVTGYCLRAGYAEVEVAWFANGDAKSAWFPDWRVERATC
jgi:hypothetical protein